MMLQTQLSVFLVNKPGVLGQVCDVLARAKVNIMALTMMDSSEHGVLRLVVEDVARAKKALSVLNVPMTETDVLCLELDNHAGALADVCQTLGEKHINIGYAYCTAGARGGRTLGVFKVADNKKALRVLKPAAKGKRRAATARAPRPGTRR
ncbi:MAG: ACT domain-containing protein [Phycisphaerae bacterium]|nr:ACT domain-containing protein [Phycisphaerae bacterium]